MALCDSLLPALAFRALAGIAVAGMYMPGLRAPDIALQPTLSAGGRVKGISGSSDKFYHFIR
jgi:hypothetical protein